MNLPDSKSGPQVGPIGAAAMDVLRAHAQDSTEGGSFRRIVGRAASSGCERCLLAFVKLG